MTHLGISRTTPFLFVTLVALLGAPTAQAIGFGIGGELGAHVGAADLPKNVQKPIEGGASAAVIFSGEVWGWKIIQLHGVGRLELNGYGVFGDIGGGAGGGLAGDLLLRTALDIPLFPVKPFLEFGGGLGVGGGGGTVDTSGFGGALSGRVSGFLAVPAAYAGVGVTIALPLLPYFEARVGSHGGLVLPASKIPGLETLPTLDAGISGLVGRVEAHIGMGYRF